MKIQIVLVATILALTSGARAQMAMSNPPADSLHIAASAVYGFKMKETGVSVDGGKFVGPGHFVGLEATYFHPTQTDYFLGFPVKSKEHLTTVLALYRFNWTVPPVPQLSLYVGGGAGVGIVRLRSDYPAFAYAASDRSNSIAAEGQAGAAWMFTPRWGVKAGYRYFRIYNVELFGNKADIHDNLAEAGITFRF
jgi:opacity protein-like surface antigen